MDSVRPPNKWKVIVLDENTLKLVENCMKLDELLHLNATNIELIERRREPNEFEACYILTPTEHNVRRIIEDLSQLGGGPLIYPGGHVFFIDGACATHPSPRIPVSSLIGRHCADLCSDPRRAAGNCQPAWHVSCGTAPAWSRRAFPRCVG